MDDTSPVRTMDGQFEHDGFVNIHDLDARILALVDQRLRELVAETRIVQDEALRAGSNGMISGGHILIAIERMLSRPPREPAQEPRCTCGARVMASAHKPGCPVREAPAQPAPTISKMETVASAPRDPAQDAYTVHRESGGKRIAPAEPGAHDELSCHDERQPKPADFRAELEGLAERATRAPKRTLLDDISGSIAGEPHGEHVNTTLKRAHAALSAMQARVRELEAQRDAHFVELTRAQAIIDELKAFREKTLTAPDARTAGFREGVEAARQAVSQLHAYYRDKMIGEDGQYGAPALAEARRAIAALSPATPPAPDAAAVREDALLPGLRHALALMREQFGADHRGYGIAAEIARLSPEGERT